jgi:hypothetical protein
MTMITNDIDENNTGNEGNIVPQIAPLVNLRMNREMNETVTNVLQSKSWWNPS